MRAEAGEGGTRAAATYRGLRSRRTVSTLGEINVTPLVDVVLVLLLVFMVTAPMMSRGIDVSLPVANQPQTEPEERIVTISINAQERIFVGDRPINLQLLEDTVRGMMEGRTRKVVYLRADESIRYGRVITVIDKLKSAGVDLVGFAYELPQEKARR
jgi:biopolymer transport protein ExbD